jgi:hypothetical protein
VCDFLNIWPGLLLNQSPIPIHPSLACPPHARFILLFVCALVLYEWGVLSWDIVGRMAAVAESIVVWRLAVVGWRIMMVWTICLHPGLHCLARNGQWLSIVHRSLMH